MSFSFRVAVVLILAGAVVLGAMLFRPHDLAFEVDRAIHLNDVRTVEKCLMSGFDLNHRYDIERPEWGHTALHTACSQCNPEIVRLLIKAGADVNVTDNGGGTPVVKIILADPNPHQLECIKILLEHGADLSIRDRYGWTAIHQAVRYLAPAMIELLLSKEPDINAQTLRGETPLRIVCELVEPGEHQLAVVRLLLDAGADVGITDLDSRTALDIAIAKKNPALIELLSKVPALESEK
jgi:ankyrin repeat protein